VALGLAEPLLGLVGQLQELVLVRVSGLSWGLAPPDQLVQLVLAAVEPIPV
jgi:hypothetical protein